MGGAFLINSIDEIALILAMPFIFRGLAKLIKTRGGRVLLGSFAAYILLGALSAIWQSIPLKQMLLQSVLELKILAYVAIFFGFSNQSIFEILDKYETLLKWILILSLPLILFQQIMPSLYKEVFSSGADQGTFLLLESYRMQRSSGLFWFSGELAIVAGIATIYFFFKYRLEGTCKVWFLLSAVVLLSTFQRNEIFATLMSIVLVAYFYSGAKSRVNFLLVLLVISPLIFSLLKPFFYHAFYQYGLADINHSEAARVVFYYHSLIAAWDHFPLGSGFGTYGGRAAIMFDSDIYHRYGFHSYWWFIQGRYLTDVFWPHVLAESGWLGLGFFSIFILSIWNIIGTKTGKSVATSSLGGLAPAAKAVFLLLLINSITAPNFYEIISFLPAMLLIAGARAQLTYRGELKRW